MDSARSQRGPHGDRAEQHRYGLGNGKALLGCRCPCIVASPWTVGDPRNPTVDDTIFDHTSVLKMIESVFNVAPLAAREKSTNVGNRLSVINLSNLTTALPVLPQPRPAIPKSTCSSSLGPREQRDEESRGFQRLHQAARQRGWPVYQ